MPRIAAAKMAGNYRHDGAWCPGCGLHAHTHNGEHRADCTKGKHLRAGDTAPEEAPQ